jgi:micrococcal nuclease
MVLIKPTLQLKSRHSLVVAVVLLLLTGCEVPPTPAVDEGAEAVVLTPTSATSISPTATKESLATRLVPTVIPTPTPDNQSAPAQEGSAATPALESLVEAVVTNAVDGDTIDVLIDGQEYRVRYIGVDTPETVHPTRGEEPYGRKASEYNKALVGGQTVFLEKDVSETDRYGRLLRYVWLEDGTMVNFLLVSGGYAQVSTFPPDVKYAANLLELERVAREDRVGLWGLVTEPAQGETPAPVQRGDCDPSYPEVCIPPPPPDLDCGEIRDKYGYEDFQVVPPDPHRFDGNKDGVGC